MFLGSVKDLYKKANVKIIYEPGEEDENNSWAVWNRSNYS
jgi:hypothetical protein